MITHDNLATNVIVNLQYEAFHNWQGVKEALPNQPELHFLFDRHRHIFHVKAEKAVSHSDRDVEIIWFKRQILNYLEDMYGRPGEFKSKSCEMLAEELLKKFDCVSVEVLEDNENGARVYSK
jgi:hypothetical protein